MTTQAILNILNPVRILTVAEWMKIAELVSDSDIVKHLTHEETEVVAIQLMQSWERLTKQPLTKSMFVCEAEKPIDLRSKESPIQSSIIEKELAAYEAAQREVLFEGFALTGDYATKGFLIFNFYGEKKERFEIVDDVRAGEIIKLTNATIFDFIIEIDRFNKTVSKKIELNFTEHFVNKLLSNG